MYVPGISKLVRRKGGGRGGKSSSSGKSSKVSNSPTGHRATTYGNGGGNPVYTTHSVWKDWYVGGETRSDVYGNISNPTIPPLKHLPWAFMPIAVQLDVYASDENLHLYYDSLPQESHRPGGKLEEMVITPKNSTLPLFFVSDSFTVGQVKKVLDKHNTCDHVFKTGKPIRFNSTGNIRFKSVVQFYRGDSAAIVVTGYEEPGNPSFPLSTHMPTWECLNTTIGESIPLADPDLKFSDTWYGQFVIVLGSICGFVACLAIMIYHDKIWRFLKCRRDSPRRGNSIPLRPRSSSDPRDTDPKHPFAEL